MSGMIKKHNPELDWLIEWQSSRVGSLKDGLVAADLPDEDDDDHFVEVKIEKAVALVTPEAKEGK